MVVGSIPTAGCHFFIEIKKSSLPKFHTAIGDKAHILSTSNIQKQVLKLFEFKTFREWLKNNFANGKLGDKECIARLAQSVER